LSDRALYVYGVIPKGTSADVFEHVRGVDPTEPVMLVCDGELAAVASAVRLDEFGEEVIEANLRDARWLAEKVQAHDNVLSAAVGRTVVLPFRFGTIYRSEAQVQDLLRRRDDFRSTLARLDGATELGVKAFVDAHALRRRLAEGEGTHDDPISAGRAYMQRRQVERRVGEDVDRFVADCARESHARLTAGARDGRANPIQLPQSDVVAERMILNGAYLVDVDAQEEFRGAVRELEHAYGTNGVRYEVTGPWPPYNFVDEEAGS
jgi:hypothetical protein